MKIKVIGALPKAAPGDVLCRFKNLEDGTEGRRGEGKGLVVKAELGRVVFDINVAAVGAYEPDEARRVAGALSLKQSEKLGAERLFWSVEEADLKYVENLLTGALLCRYRFDRFKKKNSKNKKGTLFVAAGKRAAALKKILKRLEDIDTGVVIARDLANTPPNHLTPQDLATAARRYARTFGLTFRVLRGEALRRGHFAGLLAVGGGSRHPPVLFELGWKPRRVKRGARPLCFVGKGITFDSGGLDLKPSKGMWQMKGDMSGAACVIGTLAAVSRLKLPVPVLGVVAAAENLPGPAAYRQGDVIRYRNGTTVEIRSTDAEGRLILADALLYAQQVRRQRRIVEFSTLTGACMRALGRQYSGLFSRSEELKEAVKAAAASTGERLWELPLHPEYRSQLESSVADIQNVGGPFAGAQTAALFLHEFIEEGTQYVHIDIAGTFMVEKEEKYWGQPGATGVGVRLAVALAEAEVR